MPHVYGRVDATKDGLRAATTAGLLTRSLACVRRWQRGAMADGYTVAVLGYKEKEPEPKKDK